uniref:RING-type E3 ubiquitin transferase n=1 Tax=Sparus aurata TaxID=8175 RepID=A0A671TX50_SPAAU
MNSDVFQTWTLTAVLCCRSPGAQRLRGGEARRAGGDAGRSRVAAGHEQLSVRSAGTHVCMDCKKNYCSRCSAQVEPRPRLCHTCQRFYGTLLVRAELMKLKVRELRDYLHLHEISTHLCREKEDLVELVLSQQSSPSSESAPETPITDTTSCKDVPLVRSQSGFWRLIQCVFCLVQTWDPEEAPVSGRRASLSDLSCLDDIEALSVRQLKEILARNFVDYKGCCEKWELMERVSRLYQDQQNLLESGGGPTGLEENLCKICMDSPIDCVLLEMSECPICRQYVIRAVHVFRS